LSGDSGCCKFNPTEKNQREDVAGAAHFDEPIRSVAISDSGLPMCRTALPCVLVFGLMASPLLADDAKPGGPPPELEKVRASLKKAIAIVQAFDENQRKSVGFPSLPSPEQLVDSFHHSADPEYKAAALDALANALARCGDLEGARETLKKADEITEEIRDPETHTTSLVELAEAFTAIDDKEDAADRLRRAVRWANRIKTDESFIPLPPTLDGEQGPELQRITMLGKITTAQRAAGDDDSARETMASATELASKLPRPSMQVTALIHLADAARSGEAEPFWQKAAEQAAGAKSLLERGDAFGAIIRERIKRNRGDKALDLIAGTLKGDLQAFALWVAADEMAEMENGAPREWLDRVFTMAEAAQFDRYPKKSKVYSRLSEAQARAGDEIGAEKTVGLLDATNSIRLFRYTLARVNMLVELSRTKIRKGQNDAALVTLAVVEDIIGPYQGDDGGLGFPLGKTAELLAEAGNVPAAREFLDQTQDENLHVTTLCRIAVLQAKAGDREGANATLKAALAALENIPNEILWKNGPSGLDSGSMGYVRQLILSEVAIAQAKMGEYDEALRTMNSLPQEDAPAAPFGDTDEILEIAKLRLESGDFEGARVTIESTEKNIAAFRIQDQQQALAAVAQAQAKSGAFEATLAWVETLKSPRSKLRCLAGYGQGVAERLSAPKQGE
jgi:tetratricopeptide (TPR) repeat protein